MAFTEHLPEDVVDLIRTSFVAEYATVSGAGVPIDTPTFYFPSADLKSLDIGTGLAYPAKAERARRNPKVGLLIEGTADQPVVLVAGYAAVRDSDLQANLNRYLSETIFAPNINPEVVGWDHVRKNKVYYLTRILVCITPSHVRWWKNRPAMDEQPQEWRAPADTVYPKSDAAPTGKPSEAPNWPHRTWQELAQTVFTQKLPGHLTLLDAEGFPLPIRAREYKQHPEGFCLVLPKGAPWSQGKATLSFVGKEVFVGNVTIEGSEVFLRVERALPVLPLLEQQSPEALADTYAILTKRMDCELSRRGQPRPVIPEHPPQPSEGAKLREAASRAIKQGIPGGRATE